MSTVCVHLYNHHFTTFIAYFAQHGFSVTAELQLLTAAITVVFV